MKILVFSDSHGQSYNMRRAIEMHPDCEAVIFLGDGLGDFYSLPNGNFAKLAVRGNCDWEPMFTHIPKIDTITLNSKKIIFIHGHEHGVKQSDEMIKSLAVSTNADLVLFGHTHIPFEHYEDGIYYLNPGTIGGVYTGKSTYGIITIRDNGVLLSHGIIDD